MKYKQSKVYSIDYYAYLSAINCWNSTFKVLFAFFTILFCVIANHIFVSSFIFLSMSVFTIYKGKIPLQQYLSLFMIPIIFIIFGSIAIAFGVSILPIGQYKIHLQWFYLYTSDEMIKTALQLILKAFGAVSAMYMMILSTSASEVIFTLEKLHIPSIIIELMHMVYRFIFILLDVYCKMRYSAQSRLGYCDFKTSCFTFGKIAGNLFFISLKKANAYYDALTARCYDGKLLFLEEEKKVQPIQAVGAAIYFVFLFLIWLWAK